MSECISVGPVVRSLSASAGNTGSILSLARFPMLSLHALEPMFWNERTHQNQKPAQSKEDLAQAKIRKIILKCSRELNIHSYVMKQLEKVMKNNWVEEF